MNLFYCTDPKGPVLDLVTSSGGGHTHWTNMTQRKAETKRKLDKENLSVT